MLELEIARATRQETQLSVLLFDVDGFAEINAQGGARAGDEVLRHVAATLADQVRLVDTVARYGPDEFALIAPGGAGQVAGRRVRDALSSRESVTGAHQHQRRRGDLPDRRRLERGAARRGRQGAHGSQAPRPRLDLRRQRLLGVLVHKQVGHGPPHSLGHHFRTGRSIDHAPALRLISPPAPIAIADSFVESRAVLGDICFEARQIGR